MSNFSMPIQVQTGSQVRAAKREGNVKGYTRAQAQVFIASCSDVDAIRMFEGHGNKHIRKYAGHKIDRLLNPSLPVGDLARFNVRAWTPGQAKEVLTLMAQLKLDSKAMAERIGCNPRRIKEAQKRAEEALRMAAINQPLETLEAIAS